jgi:ABC-type sugar transport system ATPase subunit
MSDHAEAVIRARGLTKTYGSVIALDGLDLEVARGRSSACSDRTGPARRRPCRS